MIIFITAVLAAAAIQSFCKLALLPRKWELAAAALIAPLPPIFESRISQVSMQQLNTTLASAATLENWCALVVIQELFTLVVGFSLLTDFESGGKVAKWKFLVFLPSLLLPAGALYGQMYLFNALPDLSFGTITGLLAAVLPAVLIATAELVRWLKPDREDRILAVLHLEYFLVFAAVFLPVAATAKLSRAADDSLPLDSFLVLGALAAMVAASLIGFRIFRWYQRYKRKAKTCQP